MLKDLNYLLLASQTQPEVGHVDQPYLIKMIPRLRLLFKDFKKLASLQTPKSTLVICDEWNCFTLDLEEFDLINGFTDKCRKILIMKPCVACTKKAPVAKERRKKER